MEQEKELKLRNNEKYKVEVIYDSKVYTKKIADKLLELYYYISEKNKNEFKNTYELASNVMHLKKINIFFYLKYLKK